MFYFTYLPFIFGFAALLAISFHITKSALSPAVLFAGVWLISLIGLFLAGDTFFNVSSKTLSIYLIGALFFSVGAILGQSFESRPLQSPFPARQRDLHRSYRYRFLDLILLILLFGLPVYWQYLLGRFGVSVGQMVMAQIRSQATQLSGTAQSFNLINNFPVIATLVAVALYYENDGTPPRLWRFYLAFVLSAVYGSMEGSKKPVIDLLLSMFFIASIRAGKIRVKMFVVTLCVGVAAFSAGLLVINFGYKHLPLNMDTLSAIAPVEQGYWLGSLVAFNQIVAEPSVIESTQKVDRFFLETANSLGANYYVPSRHADYADISTSQKSNTYTIYFTYYKDYGWFGTVGFMCFIGFVAGYIYKMTMDGQPIPVLMYAMVAVAIVYSFAAEMFFTALNGYIKALLFFTFIYKVLPLLSRRRRLVQARAWYAQ